MIIKEKMVLGRQPKKYRHFIKILTSQLIIHEHIVTTNAKVKFQLIFARLSIYENPQII